jgi:hypothetical protein
MLMALACPIWRIPLGSGGNLVLTYKETKTILFNTSAK